jgi:hypothetical protein
LFERRGRGSPALERLGRHQRAQLVLDVEQQRLHAQRFVMAGGAGFQVERPLESQLVVEM